MKKQKDTLSPNVLAFAKRFNQISNWVATEILVASSNETRIQILGRFISLEKHLMKLDNFNGLMAIHAGLSFHEISRLKPVWKVCFKLINLSFIYSNVIFILFFQKEMPEKKMRKYLMVDELMSSLDNFSNYRKKLLNTKPPFIPFQSRLLGDLATLDQMDLYIPDTGHVNFYKLTEIGQILKLVELSQSVAYSFIEVPEIKNFLTKDAFTLSKSVMFAVSEQVLANIKKQQF